MFGDILLPENNSFFFIFIHYSILLWVKKNEAVRIQYMHLKFEYKQIVKF